MSRNGTGAGWIGSSGRDFRHSNNRAFVVTVSLSQEINFQLHRVAIMNQTKVSLRSRYILFFKILVLTFVLLVLSGIGSQFLPATMTEGVPAVDSATTGLETASLSLILAIMLCQVLALTLPIVRSTWHGWRLALAMFVIFFGTQTFMSQIESLVYLGNKMPQGLVAGLFVMGLFVAAVFSPVAVLILGRWKKSPAEYSERNELNLGKGGWRFLVAGLVFLCLYYLFGYYIAWQDADLRAYYGGTDPGSFIAQMQSVITTTPWMLPVQYVRGLLWVGLGLLIITLMRRPRWHAGFAVALLFSVPSLYLLLPNPVMPDFPRITHFVETLPYQFLFGWFLAYFLIRRNGLSDMR